MNATVNFGQKYTAIITLNSIDSGDFSKMNEAFLVFGREFSYDSNPEKGEFKLKVCSLNDFPDFKECVEKLAEEGGLLPNQITIEYHTPLQGISR